MVDALSGKKMDAHLTTAVSAPALGDVVEE